jgi:hypothetical protein
MLRLLGAFNAGYTPKQMFLYVGQLFLVAHLTKVVAFQIVIRDMFCVHASSCSVGCVFLTFFLFLFTLSHFPSWAGRGARGGVREGGGVFARRAFLLAVRAISRTGPHALGLDPANAWLLPLEKSVLMA